MKRTQKEFIGKYFWLRKRFSVEKTPWIIKITGFGDSIPQKVHGELFNTDTGKVTITDNGKEKYSWNEKGILCFSCEIDEYLYPQGIPSEVLEGIKKELINKILAF